MWGFLHKGYYAGGGGGDEKEEIVRFRTYTIQNVRNGGLELALHGMVQVKVDLGILQETNIIDGVHEQDSMEFFSVTSDAPSRYHGCVAIFYKESLQFVLESYTASVLPKYRTPPQSMAPEVMYQPFNIVH